MPSLLILLVCQVKANASVKSQRLGFPPPGAIPVMLLDSSRIQGLVLITVLATLSLFPSQPLPLLVSPRTAGFPSCPWGLACPLHSRCSLNASKRIGTHTCVEGYTCRQTYFSVKSKCPREEMDTAHSTPKKRGNARSFPEQAMEAHGRQGSAVWMLERKLGVGRARATAEGP